MRLPRALLLSAALLGCGRARGITTIMTQNMAAMFGRMRRLPHRITQPVRPEARIAVLWVGHATALVQLDDRFVLTDPVFTDAVGQISPRLVEPGIAPEHLPHIDAVLISHMHFDHLSPGSLAMIEDRVGRLFVPRGGMVYVPPADYPATELGRWERWSDGALEVTAVPVRHNGWRYGADAAWMTESFTGYVVRYHGLSVYFGGDTGYVGETFRETARRFPSMDLALLPIAPIHPREMMARNHMDPPEALRAFTDLGARWMVPIHFDTFVNSRDAPGEVVATLERSVIEQHIDPARVIRLEIGEQRVLAPR